MVSSVKSRPNHYQTLGLEPLASADEISGAFARKMSLFEADPLGAAAQICIAYETLRDPIKRREHDRLLGITTDRTLQVPQWKYAVTQPRWAPLIASAERNGSPQVASDTQKIPDPQVTASSQPKTPVDPRLAAIAASVRELAKPVAARDSLAGPRPQRPQMRPAQARRDLPVDEVIEHIRSVGRAEKQRLQTEEGGFEWKRPALTLGALIVGAGVFGALAGLSLKGDETPAQSETPLTHFHAIAQHRPQVAQFSPHAALFAETSQLPQTAKRVSTSKPHPRISRETRASLFEQQIVGSLAGGDESSDGEAGKVAMDKPEAVATRKVEANLPLSTAVIARTIERIGYPCGEVASTSTADGEAPGVFRVTCTSGHTYRAAPVGGRYHFRRVNG